MSKQLEKLIRMTKTVDAILSRGDSITFESKVYGSVGIWYELDYDRSAFTESRAFEYVDPLFKENPCPGGDEQVVRVSLTAQKRGLFYITEIEDFRGERTVKRIHKNKGKVIFFPFHFSLFNYSPYLWRGNLIKQL